ncbi:MAG TPA: hypothetical protein VMM79_13875 [Longimicrobiales bacterium]|nr:hypothetical protein [Longimicrobiales bacterium]
MSAQDALHRIRLVSEDSPDAVMLARLASLAIRIEPHLLRRLRTELMPEADVSAEADLWFSPLIESAGADSIVLDADVAEVLRTDLARESALFERTARITCDAHAHLPPALQLEEEVTALALSGADDAPERIETALATALRSMTDDAGRARETARWFARAWPRLPEAVRRTPAAATLALASSMLTGRRSAAKPIDADARINDVRWVFRDRSFTEFDTIGAVLENDTVRFTEAGQTVAMRVPRTNPCVVELSWVTDASASPSSERGKLTEHEPILVDATPGTTVSLTPSVVRVTLETLAGDRYTLEYSPESGTGEASSATADEGPWIDIEPYALFAAACVRVSAGDVAYSVVRTGYRLTNTWVATASAPLAFEGALRVEPAPPAAVARPFPVEGDPVLIIEVRGDAAPGFASPPFSASRESPESDVSTTGSHDAVVLGYTGERLAAVRANAVVDEMLASTFRAFIESATPLPDEFAGGPVIIDGQVRGIVTAVEPGTTGDGVWMLTVASGLALKDALDRVASMAAQQMAEPAQAEPRRAEPGQADQAVEGETPARAPDAGAGPATGNRVAKVVVIGREQHVAEAVVKALADRVMESGGRPRKGICWDQSVRDAPGLRAGVVLWAVRTEEEWPLVLDLEDAAVAVMIEGAYRPTSKGEGIASTAEWSENVHAYIRNSAPHVAVITTNGDTPPARAGRGYGITAMSGLKSSHGAPSAVSAADPGSLRQAVLDAIDWSAQPVLDADAWSAASRLATTPLVAGPVGHMQDFLQDVGTWDHDASVWLGIMTGGRVVPATEIVFRDPAYFEEVVIAMVRAVDREKASRGLPAVDLATAERFVLGESGLTRARLPVGPGEMVHAAVQAMRHAGVATTVSTDFGPVVVVPGRADEGHALQTSGYGEPVLRADWTGDARLGFYSVLTAVAWSGGRVSDVGWDARLAQGSAAAELDGRFRVEAVQSVPIADLTVTREETSRPGSDRLIRMIRTALEEALAGNASLGIREDPWSTAS